MNHSDSYDTTHNDDSKKHKVIKELLQQIVTEHLPTIVASLLTEHLPTPAHTAGTIPDIKEWLKDNNNHILFKDDDSLYHLIDFSNTKTITANEHTYLILEADTSHQPYHYILNQNRKADTTYDSLEDALES